MRPNRLLASAPLDVLEASPDAGYVLSEQLDIIYCNQAWDRFAQENEGAAAMAVNVISRNVLDFVAPELRSFYKELFVRARTLGQPVSHDYECSSASVFRLYRIHIYPLQRGSGFVVQNSLRIERPHDRRACEPDDATYTDGSGMIHMCANCRRTERGNEPGVWDWVPAYVGSKDKRISHGICPMCLEFYYRPAIQDLVA